MKKLQVHLRTQAIVQMLSPGATIPLWYVVELFYVHLSHKIRKDAQVILRFNTINDFE